MSESGRGNSVTIDDVAARAGVSVATVSRALRGLPNVSPSTAVRVKEAAADLQYRPAPFAAALAAGRTRTVALAVPDLGWYFAKVVAGAEALLAAQGYDLLIFTLDSHATRRRVLNGPLVKRADGLVLVNIDVPRSEFDPLADDRLVVASVGQMIDGCSSVVVDDELVARLAVQHLVGLGHRDIALLAGQPHDPLNFTVPRLRRAGYLETLRHAGITPRPELEQSGNFSIDGGTEAMTALLALDQPPTAVFAMSDEMAFGAIKAIWDSGRRVPEDISIVGVDDHELSSVLSLTTVRQQVGEHGELAARLVLDQLADSSLATSVVAAPVELVVRRSTGPVAVRA